MHLKGWMVVIMCCAFLTTTPCFPQSKHGNGNAYVDPWQESNINNVIHAHTRMGNGQLQTVCDDPRDPCGRNAREFGNNPDQAADSAPQAANVRVKKAAKFAVSDGRRLSSAESWQPYIDGAISCKEQAVITSAPEGLAYVTIGSNNAKWSLPGPRPDWPPTLAGNTVALIADSYNLIFGFSRRTGKQIWDKEVSSNVLASDGRYFYTIRAGDWDLQALNPNSGAVMWSLKLPHDPQGGYTAFLKVHDGRLFTVNAVADISRRTIVHRWPSGSSFVTAIGFDGHNILVGDSAGFVSAYDRNFKCLWRAYAGKEHVVSVASAGEHVLALLYLSQRGSTGAYHELAFLTRQGKPVWRLPWKSVSEGFTVSGDQLLSLEPGTTKGQFQLTSRELATSKVNWANGNAYLYGSPVVCEDTVYVSDGNRLHSFDLHTGAEKMASKKAE